MWCRLCQRADSSDCITPTCHPARAEWQDHGFRASCQVAQLPRPDGQGRHHGDAVRAPAKALPDIDSGRFVDYTELERGFQSRRGEVQSLLEQRCTSGEGRFKVFMIDEVHMLTATRSTAMLKTLEDRPSTSKFVRGPPPMSEKSAGNGAVALFAIQPAADGAAKPCRSHVGAGARRPDSVEARCLRGRSRLLRAPSAGARHARYALSLTRIGQRWFGGGKLEEASVPQSWARGQHSWFRLLESRCAGRPARPW